MVFKRKSRETTEYGDFQTPLDLALAATRLLRALEVNPRSILEPTCGRGAFLTAASDCFPHVQRLVGVDVNPSYLQVARINADPRAEISCGDFFQMPWIEIVNELEGPLLILGNPPWVTNSSLGALASPNLPEKSNFQKNTGMDAMTGKSNFDISEWMLLRYLEWLKAKQGYIAVLCKTAVARKVLLHLWKKGTPISFARIYKINALAAFGAAVDACFFVLSLSLDGKSNKCGVYESLSDHQSSLELCFSAGHMISDSLLFEKYKSMLGNDPNYTWRSGVKHDCSKVMELKPAGNGCYKNGLDEVHRIGEEYLYPMLKSSDIGNGRTSARSKMLVSQKYIGEDTRHIMKQSPLTWKYLRNNAERLKARSSSIYRGRPEFSVFGVGPYAFSPWKVAISGFYKRLNFVKVGPDPDGTPTVFDDTIYFLPCATEDEADFVHGLLHSEGAQGLLSSMIHWQDKRPITADLLRRISIRKIAEAEGLASVYARFHGSDASLFDYPSTTEGRGPSALAS